MIDDLHYAFIDESGSAALSTQNHFLVVAALCTGNPHSLARIVRRVQKKFGTSLSDGELKAKKANQRLIAQLLNVISKEPIEIYVVVMNRQIIQHPPKDAEDIYRWAMSRVVSMLVKRHPHIEVSLDKRYTKESLRYRLEKEIRKELIRIPHSFVLIKQEDSVRSKGLQAVDFLAWSFLQKYEKGNCQYYDMISNRIVEEDCVSKQVWENSRATKNDE